MKLYFITAENEDGNFDLAVQAGSVEIAVKLWREHWDFDATTNSDDEPDPAWSGEILTGMPAGNIIAQVALAWEINNIPNVEGVVHWGGWTEITPNPNFKAGRMKLVAYVPYR